MSDVDPARVIGVLGAGTMGAGIAQLACRSGARTLLYDPLPEALQRGAQQIANGPRRRTPRAVGSATASAPRRHPRGCSTVSDFAELAPV